MTRPTPPSSSTRARATASTSPAPWPSLLRFNGIPARVAVGFTAGDKRKDGWFVVDRNDAHAWVEAYFPGVGWVPFDPTPGRTLPGPGGSSTSAGFVDPGFDGGAGGPRQPRRHGAGRAPGGAASVDPDPSPPAGGDVPRVGAVPPLAAAVVSPRGRAAAWPWRAVRRAVAVRRGTRSGGCGRAGALIADDLRTTAWSPALADPRRDRSAPEGRSVGTRPPC